MALILAFGGANPGLMWPYLVRVWGAMQYTLIRICKKMLIQIATLAYLPESHGALCFQSIIIIYLVYKYARYAKYATFFAGDSCTRKKVVTYYLFWPLRLTPN